MQEPATSDITTAQLMKVRQTVDELTAFSKRPAYFWWGWGLALGLTVLLVVLASLPPFVGPRMNRLLMEGFASVCHQLPDRSPQVGGVPLAVCHRCFGIYLGLPLAVLGFLVLSRWDARLGRHAPLILFGALLIPGIDWMLGITNLWQNTPHSRLVTGGLFGFVAGYYLARAFSQVFAPRNEASQKMETVASATSEEICQPEESVSVETP